MPLYENCSFPNSAGLYDPSYEHESCGLAFIANIEGAPSHKVVASGLEMLQNLSHRGAVGADPETGDGAGILLQLCDSFFRSQVDFALPAQKKWALGQVFLPLQKELYAPIKERIEDICAQRKIPFLGWRSVPVLPMVCGQEAQKSRPAIAQFFISLENGTSDFELYLLRKVLEKNISDLEGYEEFYLVSLSSDCIVYKGMLVAQQLAKFFPDLTNPLFTSSFALVHQRFSTNTFPSWRLAHPYRVCAHNGEFNTIQGNINAMKAREGNLQIPWEGDVNEITPIIQEGLSDSSAFDNALEFLLQTKRDLPHALAMLIPEAWSSRRHMPAERRDFYQYHANLMEPWDGPAAVAAYHQGKIAAILDRNGLRPARFTITKDKHIIFGSEAGILDIAQDNVLHKGRLFPGKMLVIDLNKKLVLFDDDCKAQIYSAHPYSEWVKGTIELIDLPDPLKAPKPLTHELDQFQRAFAYSEEELRQQFIPMVTSSYEALGSMGYDASILPDTSASSFFNFFRQRFAQVTNPAIDPIREEIVMGISNYFGVAWNMFQSGPEFSRQLKLTNPVLNNFELLKLAQSKTSHLRGCTLPIIFPKNGGNDALQLALEDLKKKVSDSVHQGHNALILSDRGIDYENVAIPAALSVACVHHHLIDIGKRQGLGIIVETGQAWSVHHFAVLISYGANGINPYLAYDTIRDLRSKETLPDIENSEYSAEDPCSAYDRNYQNAICRGLYKIMSKMGISTLRSYHGAQTFEILGLSEDVVNKYFIGTSSRFGGIGLQEIQEDAKTLHEFGFAQKSIGTTSLPWGGIMTWRPGGQAHLNNPETIALLQHAVRSGEKEKYQKYCEKINSERVTLRSALEIGSPYSPCALSEVEPVEAIVARFVSGAMSLGALSKEAHENLAIGMNILGGKSNSGEGGEDRERDFPTEDGLNRKSKIRQIASARFGVTTEYLVHAEEIQIKIAQGAKPGEGGQLPGHKVSLEIAKLRHSTTGVSLISPPPHHDIYSIEDLAQLIFDLQNLNPKATISVKLVAEQGVGTVAAGVAKAFANTIIIAGHDGGTGASPISSIRHCGMPWELGLAETQQTLILNGLRSRVRLQVDGQLKTGRDVIIAAALGADEFGFATAALIAQGCIMTRKCHQDTCPVGIATQNPLLREKFPGKPEHIVRFFTFIAQDVRESLAALGFKSLQELVGRSDILHFSKEKASDRAKMFEWQRLLYKPQTIFPNFAKTRSSKTHNLPSIDEQIIEIFEKSEKTSYESTYPIRSKERAVGTKLSGWLVAKKKQSTNIKLTFRGSSGQSFGAFLSSGIELTLEGEANDYLAKGMSGGRIILKSPTKWQLPKNGNTLAGNTLLYGATAGEVYIAGSVGERFAVRNSGATAIVEGVGDHGCEYMTGGRVVVLGATGRNFAAGMSGGIAYVLDEERFFSRRCNTGMVDLEHIADEDENFLRSLLNRHYQFTNSQLACEILADWPRISDLFVKVMPREYRRFLRSQGKEIDHGRFT